MKKSSQAASIIGTILCIGIIGGLYFALKSKTPPSPQSPEAAAPQQGLVLNATATAAPAATTSSAIYFATVNAKEPRFISIYSLDGAEIKKIPAPTQGVTKAAGDTMYSGVGDGKILNGIGAFSFQTNTFTTPITSSNAILAWDVSPEPKKIAWIDTAAQLHLANADGSEPETHQLPQTSSAGTARGWAAVQFSQDGRSVISSTAGSWNIWRADAKSFATLPETQDQIFSPTLRYGTTLHDTDGTLVITQTDTGETSDVLINPPDAYVQLAQDSSCSFAPLATVVAFSPDESQLLIRVGALCDGEKSETFIAYIDGGITRKLIEGYRPLAYLDKNTILVKADDGTLAIASADDGKILKTLPDQTEYVGRMSGM